MQFIYPVAQQTKFLSLQSEIELLFDRVQALKKMRTLGVQLPPAVDKDRSVSTERS
jgi:hypothetical protein